MYFLFLKGLRNARDIHIKSGSFRLKVFVFLEFRRIDFGFGFGVLYAYPYPGENTSFMIYP
jgi:hypothetical protein